MGNLRAKDVNVRVLVNVLVPERCVTIAVAYFPELAAFCGRTELLWQIVTEKDLLQVCRDHSGRLRASVIFGHVHVYAHEREHVHVPISSENSQLSNCMALL